MSIKDAADLEGMRRVSRVVRETLALLEPAVKPGVTTGELEALARRVFEHYGARSAPTLFYDFPGTVLISLNDEAVHGIPSQRIIQAGDVVKLDVTPELDGYIADAAITVAVPPVKPAIKGLLKCSRMALQKALELAKAGVRVNDLGRLIDREVRRQGFSVIRELGGHGIGRAIHEEPSILNFSHPSNKGYLSEGLVITIEPIIALGSGEVYQANDGWTVKTRDKSPVAHFEHTLMITRGRPLVLTA
jgi:methionyl aminopeptidase